MIIVFRYDDFSSKSPTDFELRLIESLARLRIPCTFGVIPFLEYGDTHDVNNLTSQKAAILSNMRDSDIFEIALHGYDHRNLFQNGKPLDSEFAGLGFATQFEKISRGKLFLESLIGEKVQTFIPPWNSYDYNTIQVLEKLNFRSISASNKMFVKLPDVISHLIFLPQTCSLQRLRFAIESTRRHYKGESIIVVLFHAYDFLEISESEGKISFENFLELLAWLKSQKDVDLLNIGQTAAVIKDLKYGTLLKNQSILKALSLRPLLPACCLQNIYLESNTAGKFRIKQWTITTSSLLAFLPFFSLTAYYVTVLVEKMSLPTSILKRIFGFGILFLLIFCNSLIKRGGKLGRKRALLIVFVLGAALGNAAFIIKRGAHFWLHK